ncbi:Sec7-domain-containing protein [Sistotremastrum niveocremeum HHB9708]|nr:Sec7-domain-containing protein [Sistotremastrum niveocremeum HHB9708]
MQEISLASPVKEKEQQELPVSAGLSSPTRFHARSPPTVLPTRNSLSVSSQSSHQRSLTLSRGHTVSTVLITSALDTIKDSREAKRSAPLREATKRAFDMINSGPPELFDPRIVFEALKLACETRSEKLMVASLDCISKLISYSFFSDNNPPSQLQFVSPTHSPTSSTDGVQPALAELITHTVTSAYTETTPDAVSLQIVKALLALVLSPDILIHHSSLLKAVRSVYNVFLLSQDPVTQMVAQGGLTQIVNHVFSRCKAEADREKAALAQSPYASSSNSNSQEASMDTLVAQATPLPPTPHEETNGHADPMEKSEEDGKMPHDESPPSEKPNGKANGHHQATSHSELRPTTPGPTPISVRSFEKPNPNDNLGDGDNVSLLRQMSTYELFVKDAFLVFRALCKLTMKPLATESERDIKSHAMRSKLLSLHLILNVLNSHMSVFVDPTSIIYSGSSGEATQFLQATKQYLCLSLSRNAVSSVPQIFEISVEMLWTVISGMRTKLKKEIEVLLTEIFIPILELRMSTLRQKASILSLLSRLSQDPQALVDIYINYDCDSEALENIYERVINIISKMASQASPANHNKAAEAASPSFGPTHKHHSLGSAVPPSLSTSALSMPGTLETNGAVLSESLLKRQALECLVSVLRSLAAWGTTSAKSIIDAQKASSTEALETENGKLETRHSTSSVEKLVLPLSGDPSRVSTPDLRDDDPDRFQNAKQRKTTLLAGIKKFNFKPKAGVAFFIDAGFISAREPEPIAKFLMSTDGLSKTMIGEYLGEGEEANKAIMHAFVDLLDFSDLSFTDALRMFLQAFRLPGEAQKIDRFMLKFAEKYIEGNSQTPFKNADAAYVLAYSTIMLNTDAHNPQVKNRMTKLDFVKNNRGINDGENLPEEFLGTIFDEIQSNEIRMKDEVEAGLLNTLPSANQGLAGAIANVGRDFQKEAYIMQSTGMLSRTEALFKTMTRSHRGRPSEHQFFSASHYHHVKPMFEVAWMSYLAGLSGPLQDTNDLEIVELCLDGFKMAIHIVCFFDLDLQRTSFVTTLAKFTFLNNLGEMKTKNMEAIKTLLDVAVNEGNQLKGCWRDILTCVSQLERMQLIGGGFDVPDGIRNRRQRKPPAEELAAESRSTHITVAADMVFSLSHYLSGSAIVDFVQALSDISWEEIQSSGMSETPRLFSLQKLVEISYYNMGRIRIEWSNMWAILGEHFNMICCHNNIHVVFFALDALRQLAMRFLEKEELSHFKFQKDFLKPFEYTMIHNTNNDARDMVLQCLQQMIQARMQNMRSGWRTMFGVFSAAARANNERVTTTGFEIVTRLNEDHFETVVQNGAFADLTVCITDFCKASRFQKVSLLAIAMLRGIIPRMLDSPVCLAGPPPSSESGAPVGLDEPTIKFWYPVLFGFYDIIMNGEDLEVRQMALDSLFSTLKKYGTNFPADFWDTICKELLFPIFAVLKSTADVSRFSTQEDMSVWFSTTMVEALRNVIDLYTHYFDLLERTLDGLLELLSVCICQENDTIARIGTSCFQKLLESNVKKLSKSHWERVVSTFVKLYKMTTPHQLFDENLRVEYERSQAGDSLEGRDSQGAAMLPAPISSSDASVKADSANPVQARRRVFQQIVVKCVLQLLLIETTHELLQNREIYETIPPEQLLRLMGVLDHSYQFARSFNDDKELRNGLWKVGFMKHLPNLLKQESASASTLVNVLFRMYFDTRPDHQASKQLVADRLLPLGLGVIQDFNKLKPESNMKSIAAWSPVVAVILHGFCGFEDQGFKRYLPAIYPLVTDILSREMTPDIRLAARTFFVRVGKLQNLVES